MQSFDYSRLHFRGRCDPRAAHVQPERYLHPDINSDVDFYCLKKLRRVAEATVGSAVSLRVSQTTSASPPRQSSAGRF